jgi:hypothetical protein
VDVVAIQVKVEPVIDFAYQWKKMAIYLSCLYNSPQPASNPTQTPNTKQAFL